MNKRNSFLPINIFRNKQQTSHLKSRAAAAAVQVSGFQYGWFSPSAAKRGEAQKYKSSDGSAIKATHVTEGVQQKPTPDAIYIGIVRGLMTESEGGTKTSTTQDKVLIKWEGEPDEYIYTDGSETLESLTGDDILSSEYNLRVRYKGNWHYGNNHRLVPAPGTTVEVETIRIKVFFRARTYNVTFHKGFKGASDVVRAAGISLKGNKSIEVLPKGVTWGPHPGLAIKVKPGIKVYLSWLSGMPSPQIVKSGTTLATVLRGLPLETKKHEIIVDGSIINSSATHDVLITKDTTVRIVEKKSSIDPDVLSELVEKVKKETMMTPVSPAATQIVHADEEPQTYDGYVCPEGDEWADLSTWISVTEDAIKMFKKEDAGITTVTTRDISHGPVGRKMSNVMPAKQYYVARIAGVVHPIGPKALIDKYIDL